MSTPEEQMAAAVQQLNVRLQQPGTMATILQAERGDLASHVQCAASTTTQKQLGVVDTRVIGRPDEFDGDPRKYTDWLSKLRSARAKAKGKTARTKAKARTRTQRMSRRRNRKGMIRKDATSVRRQGMFGLNADRDRKTLLMQKKDQ